MYRCRSTVASFSQVQYKSGVVVVPRSTMQTTWWRSHQEWRIVFLIILANGAFCYGECGPQNISVYEDPITLKSPHYPDPYPNNLNCIWRIKGELMKPVTMRIQDFDMEEGYDYLEVVFPGEEEKHIELTGEDVSRRTVTWDGEAGVLMLEMKTDRDTTKRGFSMLISHYQNYTGDEADLEALCETDEFHCGKGFCITNSSRCNGYPDCKNYEDELNCACGESDITLNNSTTLTSVSYPNNHPHNALCIWFITGDVGSSIAFRFSVFDTEKDSDKVTIGNGHAPSDDDSIIGHFSGSLTSLVVFSNDHTAWMKFMRHSSGTRIGFNLTIAQERSEVSCGANEFACKDTSAGLTCLTRDDTCGGDGDDFALLCPDGSDESYCRECGPQNISIYEDPITLKSPLYPKPYPNDMNCIWLIKGELMKPVTMRIQDFEMEEDNDRLEVNFYWEGEKQPRELFRLTGEDISRRTVTWDGEDGVLRMEMKTDFSRRHRGFSMLISHYQNYTGDEGDLEALCKTDEFHCGNGFCITNSSRCNGYPDCTNNQDELNCGHCGGISTINVTDGQFYVLQTSYELDDINFPHQTSTCVWHITASGGYRIKITFKEYMLSEDTALSFGHGEVLDSNVEAMSSHGTHTHLYLISETNNLWIALNSSSMMSAHHLKLEIEELRPVECNEDEFACPSGLACIPRNQVCDGYPHCPMKGDEIGCGSCSEHQYMCPDGGCIDALQDVCNAIPDCLDLWDEMNCFPCGESSITFNNSVQTSATLTSPYYPNDYPDKALCVWFITGDVGSVIAFQFSVFNTEKELDKVTIGNGHAPSESDSIIGHFSGSLTSLAVFSNDNTAWMEFTSDYSETEIGFEVGITQERSEVSCGENEFACKDTSTGLTCLARDDTCGGDGDDFALLCPDGSDESYCRECGPQNISIYEDPITLKSPLYPKPYPNDMNCIWLIKGELMKPVTMRIQDFEMEVDYDHLEVDFHWEGEKQPRELFRLTGEDISRRTVAWDGEAGVLRLEMKTNRDTRKQGFSMLISHYQNYTGDEGDLEALCETDEFHCGNGFCITNSSRCNGYPDCTNNQDELNCGHCGGISTINVTDGQFYVLQTSYEMDDINFPHQTSTCVWHITASGGYRIKITFKEYMLSEDTALSFGHGEVLDSNVEAMSSHGTHTHLYIISETNSLWIALNSSSMMSAHQLKLEIEELRPVECNEDEFACPSGLACIPQIQFCDGYPHCPMKGDEIGCGSCSEHQYMCPDGGCIDALQDVCNAIPDCLDLLDEMNCFPCGESGITLNNSMQTSATLTSPYYPNDYRDKALCVWFITGDVGSVIAFRFSVFNTEKEVDKVTIGNGHAPSESDSIIGNFSGSLTSLAVFSNDNRAWMEFTSDYLVTEIGFEVSITQERSEVSCGENEFACKDTSAGLTCLARDDTCGGDGDDFVLLCPDGSDESYCRECGPQNISIYEDPITLTSPLYSNPYPNKLNCVWLIKGELMKPVIMRIQDFDMEEGYDYLEVVFPGEGEKPIELTGEDISRRTVTWDGEAGVLMLEMKTDESRRHRGFSMLISHYQNYTGDEGDLEALCETDEFHCGNGFCITNSSRCNGYPDCTNKQDELNCVPCGESDITLNSTQTSARLTSVYYPIKYPNNALCRWFVTADVGSAITFRFSVFNTEESYDIVTIGNGHAPSNGDSSVGHFSGSLTSLTVFSNDNTAWMEFTSDISLTKIGFEVTITQEKSEVSCGQDEFTCRNTSSGLICLALDDTCDGFALCPDESDESNCGECRPQIISVYEYPINITSPLYPNLYPNDLNCIWLIKSELKQLVTLRIKEFEMEESRDYLEVIFPGEGEEPKQTFRLTGEDISRRTVTWDGEAGVLRLEMKTDVSRRHRGFFIVISHTEEEDLEALCEPDEFHCGNYTGFCVTNSSRCNGYLDCINYEDELNCDDIFCPGSYKCNNLDTSSLSISFTGDLPRAQCIPMTQVCDGEKNCPEPDDDEIQCDVKRCPAGCKCSYKGTDLVVNCNNGWDSSTLDDLALITHTLQLSGLNFSELDQGMFKALSHLKVLSLKNNVISEIQERTFYGLESLLWLDLSNTSMKELHGFAMEELSSLRGITIFDVPLTRIKTNAFSGLGHVKTLIIVRNIKDLPPLIVEDDAFQGLDDVAELYVDDHRLCCFFPSSECKTLEPQPPLFMCSELMPKMVLKVFMWILGVSALIGNIYVMVWRYRERSKGRESRIVQSFLVFNLAVSDALMGLYMLIIASADVYFGERYFEVSMEWRTSPMCKIAGFISIIGSEASVFFLTFISIDRYLAIVHPLKKYNLCPESSRIAALCVWIGTVIVGLVPTILASDSSSDVYGLSDVCIGLPLMTKVTEYETVDQQIDAGGVANITVGIPYPVDYRASWFFSIALFLGVNLLCFTVILICYIAIFRGVRASSKKVNSSSRDDEQRLAIKMAAIILTDFVCWVPVIIMGILSQAHVVEIPTEAYAWIVVFILPINSSLNPYLYTIADLCYQKRKSASVRRKSDLAMKNTRSNSENRSNIPVVKTVTSETQLSQ
ncbi:CUB and sushi domain-containing protein 2-like [Patiria miniata]|uniref:Uncharacterized protein n=1 Tax=Patiria miniata TaxID=46514 RepID=A0A913ZGR5_PATMI|nr:CUB and sushi domain-containing protein 2-like [Patiria miniata]